MRRWEQWRILLQWYVNAAELRTRLGIALERVEDCLPAFAL